MKPQDPNIIEVTYREFEGFKPRKGRNESAYMSKQTYAKSRNEFFKAAAMYAFTLNLDGFKLKIAGLDDRKLIKADHGGRVLVAGVEPGFYEITEQTEDFIIATKIHSHQ